MPKRTRDPNKAKWFRNTPCIVCLKTETTTGDHIKTFGSGGTCNFSNMWGLCFEHHREKEDIKVKRFVDKHKHLAPILIAKGWGFDEFSNKWIRLANEGWEA